MARTAAIAGTATAVSNRVSRRQAGRWAEEEQQQAPPQQYAAPPPQQYAPAPAAPAPDAPSQADVLSQLKQLGELRDAGVLTEEEFARQKAKLLG
ncbi:MAG TPA: SHOCT domain-containing protein [Nocardioides sp.]|nr:SHOCT domain-containing protein [Nocardioides sp.]